MNWTLFNWFVLAAAAVLMIWIGIRSAKTVVSTDDESGFLLGGKGVGVFAGACTIIATGASGWAFIGATQSAYVYGGIEVMANNLYAPAFVLVALFFGKYLSKRAEEQGSMTVPELIAQRHCEPGRTRNFLHGLAAFVTIGFLLVFLTAQIRAVGATCGTWLGISEQLASAIIMILIIIYTSIGGIMAVIKTDIIMVIGMMVATIIINVQIVTDISWPEMFAALQAIDAEMLNPTTAVPYSSKPAGVMMILPYAFIFLAVTPQLSVRYMALKKNTNHTQLAIMIAIFIGILHFIPFTGLYMRVKEAGITNTAAVMSLYLQKYQHPAVGSILTLFIVFAMKSTINSILHTLSSAVSHDLRTAMFPGREFKQEHVLLANRLAVVLIGVLAFVGTFFLPMGTLLNFFNYLGSGGVVAMFVGPVLIGMFWRGNAAGAIGSILAGGVVTVLMLFGVDAGWGIGPLTGAGAGIVAYVLVSVVTKKRAPKELTKKKAA